MYIATGYLTVGGREYTPGEIIREDIDEERKAFFIRANVLRETRGDGNGRKAAPAPAELPEEKPAVKKTAAKKPEPDEIPAVEAEEDEEPAVPPEVGAEEVVVRKGRKRK